MVMNIVYACDDNFAEIMGVSILSLLERNQSVENINFHILEMAISDENKEKLKKIVIQYNRIICFYSLDCLKSKLDKMSQQRGGSSTFSRLYVSQFLPNIETRALYLDCDTLVMDNLSDLYNQDFEGNIVCGVLDIISKQHRKVIGLADNDIYVNAGILLIDIVAWKKAEIEKTFDQIIYQFKGNVPYADQGILNLALKGQIKCVHPRYNCMSIFTTFSFDELLEYRQPSCCLSSFDVEKAKKNPAIVHFVTLFCIARPWVKNANGMYFDKWREFKDKSPWATLPFRKDARKKIHRILAGFYKNTPKWVSLPVIGLLHSRIKPQLRRFL